jgi:hypothetical protein
MDPKSVKWKKEGEGLNGGARISYGIRFFPIRYADLEQQVPMIVRYNHRCLAKGEGGIVL